MRSANRLILGAATSLLLAQGWAQAPAGPSAGTDGGRGGTAAPIDRAATIERARALMQARDYPASIALYQGLRVQSPRDDDLAIELARVLGYADRNRESAALYRELLAFAPQRRDDVLDSLAWQSLWGGDAAGAEPLFVELTRSARPLAIRTEAWRGLAEARQTLGRLDDALLAYDGALALKPDDLPMQRRRAQMLLWVDRHAESIAAFEALTAKYPEDRLSGLGLAQARNFAGRHRAALATWRGIGAPANHDERLEVARALRWAGFEDLAHDTLDGVPLADAQWLRRWRTSRELRPTAWATLERATDRDRLVTRAALLGATARLGPARSVDVAWRRVDLSDPFGAARGDRLSATYGWRIGDPYAASGTVWPSLTLAANRYPQWSPVTGSARVKWVPRDGLRVDAEWSREVIETPLALSNRVTVDVAALGAEWRPDPRWSAAASLAALRFDDGNQRHRINGRIDYALRFRPKVVVGLEGQAFSSSDPTGPPRAARGYWNPRHYNEARAYVGLYHDAQPWEIQARLGLGVSRETDGFGNRSSGSPNLWEFSLGRDLSPLWRLRLFAGGSGSGLGSASGGSGYWRRYVGATVTGWW